VPGVLVLELQSLASAKDPSSTNRGASDLLMKHKLHTDLGSVPGRGVTSATFFALYKHFVAAESGFGQRQELFPKPARP